MMPPEIKVEIKTEIPATAMGRAVHAILDAVSPVTEGLGAVGDEIRAVRQVREQRRQAAWRVMKGAEEMAQRQGIEPEPVPMKLLLPLLEKASLEEADEGMFERWSALLLSGSKSYQAEQLTFADILSRLSSEELRLLEDIVLSCSQFPEAVYPQGHIEGNRHIVRMAARMASDGARPATVDTVWESFQKHCGLIYGGLLYATIRSSGELAYRYTEWGTIGAGGAKSVELLERERLLVIEREAPAGVLNEVHFFSVTYLGLSFVKACSPRAVELMAQRAIKPAAL